jgi:GGDEF domain-containing protein
MISFQKSLQELDRISSLEHAALECYWSAIRSAEQYLVEVEPAECLTTRSQLAEVLAIAENLPSPEQLLDTRGRLRASLREYQERAHAHIARLRGDLNSAIAAMQSVADSITAQEGDHGAHLAKEIKRLKESAALDDIQKIRYGVLASAQGIESCVERIQRENQLAIARLSDEIRALQEQVETSGRLIQLDPSTGLLNHQQMELRVEVAASDGITQSLCLVYIAVRNYKLLCHQSGHAFADAALAALAARVRGVFGPEAHIGRWSDDEILVLAHGDPAGVLARSKRASANTSGSYPIQTDGQLRNATLQTQVLFLERRTGESAANILRRIDDFAMTPPAPSPRQLIK